MGPDRAHAAVLVPGGARAQQLLQAHRAGRHSAAGGQLRPFVLLRGGRLDEGAPAAGSGIDREFSVLGTMVLERAVPAGDGIHPAPPKTDCYCDLVYVLILLYNFSAIHVVMFFPFITVDLMIISECGSEERLMEVIILIL